MNSNNNWAQSLIKTPHVFADLFSANIPFSAARVLSSAGFSCLADLCFVSDEDLKERGLDDSRLQQVQTILEGCGLGAMRGGLLEDRPDICTRYKRDIIERHFETPLREYAARRQFLEHAGSIPEFGQDVIFKTEWMTPALPDHLQAVLRPEFKAAVAGSEWLHRQAAVVVERSIRSRLEGQTVADVSSEPSDPRLAAWIDGVIPEGMKAGLSDTFLQAVRHDPVLQTELKAIATETTMTQLGFRAPLRLAA